MRIKPFYNSIGYCNPIRNRNSLFDASRNMNAFTVF